MGSSDGPPGVPDVERGFVRRHAVELAVLGALPVMALLGFLDAGTTTASAEGAGVRVEVEHPRLARATTPAALRVQVGPVAGPVADAARSPVEPVVRLTESWLAGFRVTGSEPAAVGPGEWAAAEVAVELEASRWGVRRGEVRVAWDGGAEVVVPIRTIILP